MYDFDSFIEKNNINLDLFSMFELKAFFLQEKNRLVKKPFPYSVIETLSDPVKAAIGDFVIQPAEDGFIYKTYYVSLKSKAPIELNLSKKDILFHIETFKLFVKYLERFKTPVKALNYSPITNTIKHNYIYSTKTITSTIESFKAGEFTDVPLEEFFQSIGLKIYFENKDFYSDTFISDGKHYYFYFDHNSLRCFPYCKEDFRSIDFYKEKIKFLKRKLDKVDEL